MEGRKNRGYSPIIISIPASYLDKKENHAIRKYWDIVDQYDLEMAKKINWTDPDMASIKDMTYQVNLAFEWFIVITRWQPYDPT